MNEYTVAGQAIGSGVWVSNDKIQNKLIEEARRKGVDAILITGLGITAARMKTKSMHRL